MLRLGLIGDCLKHSKSKEMYSKILNCDFEYDYLEYKHVDEIPCLKTLMRKYNGLSVTSPYKKYVFERVESDSSIKSLKAVNSLKLNSKELEGTNTDYLASKEIIKKYNNSLLSSVLIVGDGDMSRVIRKILEDEEISYKITSRKIDSLSLLSKKAEDFDLVINCCSRDFDLSEYSFNQKVRIWDLNYNQNYEKIIVDKIGSRYSNGEELLYLQALYSCRYWEISEHF